MSSWSRGGLASPSSDRNQMLIVPAFATTTAVSQPGAPRMRWWLTRD
jgi:hypothetical protein